MTKSIPARLRQQESPSIAQAAKEGKQYYFLAVGTVYMHEVDKPEDVVAVSVDGVFANKTGLVATSSLADAQRVLQQRASDKTGGANLSIVDVLIQNIVKLGHMTPTEFHDLGGLTEEKPSE